jgi:hypothetical protein
MKGFALDKGQVPIHYLKLLSASAQTEKPPAKTLFDLFAVQISLKLVEALFVRAQARFIGNGNIHISKSPDGHLPASFQHLGRKSENTRDIIKSGLLVILEFILNLFIENSKLRACLHLVVLPLYDYSNPCDNSALAETNSSIIVKISQ